MLKRMMTSAEFAAKWNALRAAEPVLAQDDNSRLRTARPQDVADKNISLQDRQFFVETGLPWSAEPAIWFDGVHKGLPRIWEVYGPQSNWKEDDKLKLAPYFVIGSTEEDDPICVDESQDGQIIALFHDDYFARYQFINSSILQFAECLLIFNSPWGENLGAQLKKVDATAVSENSFWWQTLNDIR